MACARNSGRRSRRAGSRVATASAAPPIESPFRTEAEVEQRRHRAERKPGRGRACVAVHAAGLVARIHPLVRIGVERREREHGVQPGRGSECDVYKEKAHEAGSQQQGTLLTEERLAGREAGLKQERSEQAPGDSDGGGLKGVPGEGRQHAGGSPGVSRFDSTLRQQVGGLATTHSCVQKSAGAEQDQRTRCMGEAVPLREVDGCRPHDRGYSNSSACCARSAERSRSAANASSRASASHGRSVHGPASASQAATQVQSAAA